MKPSDRINELAVERYALQTPGGRIVDNEARARAMLDYLDEQHELERRRQHLCSAYCAFVLAACSYPGYDPGEPRLRELIDRAWSVGLKLGIPSDVVAVVGDSPHEALARFGAWLEKTAGGP